MCDLGRISRSDASKENGGIRISRRYLSPDGAPVDVSRLESGDRLIIELAFEAQKECRTGCSSICYLPVLSWKIQAWPAAWSLTISMWMSSPSPSGTNNWKSGIRSIGMTGLWPPSTYRRTVQCGFFIPYVWSRQGFPCTASPGRGYVQTVYPGHRRHSAPDPGQKPMMRGGRCHEI